MGQKIRLRREKEIISIHGETGGKEEFIMVEQVSVRERYYVLVIEAKRSSFGEAFKRHLGSFASLNVDASAFFQ